MSRYQHKVHIRPGTYGEISYIEEELDELKDTTNQGRALWSMIEASDLIGAVGKLTWRSYATPLWMIVILYYCRVPYKLVRNTWRRAKGLGKVHNVSDETEKPL